MEQLGNGEATQPLPFVTHPVYHSTQPSFVTVVAGAEVQALALQLVPNGNPSQFPSYPFSPEQSTSVPGYPEQGPQVAVQPLPVEKQPESQALHAVWVLRVLSASEQT